MQGQTDDGENKKQESGLSLRLRSVGHGFLRKNCDTPLSGHLANYLQLPNYLFVLRKGKQ